MVKADNVALLAADVCKVSFSTAANLSELMAAAGGGAQIFMTDAGGSQRSPRISARFKSFCCSRLQTWTDSPCSSLIWKSAVGNSGREGEGGVGRGGWMEWVSERKEGWVYGGGEDPSHRCKQCEGRGLTVHCRVLIIHSPCFTGKGYKLQNLKLFS